LTVPVIPTALKECTMIGVIVTFRDGGYNCSQRLHALPLHSLWRCPERTPVAANVVEEIAATSDPVQAVIQVRTLAAQLGGISNLKKLVDVLAE
jgi:hypothetical protein